eukprot:366454-Chlamydomonas_euryale.AAC.20
MTALHRGKTWRKASVPPPHPGQYQAPRSDFSAPACKYSCGPALATTARCHLQTATCKSQPRCIFVAPPQRGIRRGGAEADTHSQGCKTAPGRPPPSTAPADPTASLQARSQPPQPCAATMHAGIAVKRSNHTCRHRSHAYRAAARSHAQPCGHTRNRASRPDAAWAPLAAQPQLTKLSCPPCTVPLAPQVSAPARSLYHGSQAIASPPFHYSSQVNAPAPPCKTAARPLHPPF